MSQGRYQVAYSNEINNVVDKNVGPMAHNARIKTVGIKNGSNSIVSKVYVSHVLLDNINKTAMACGAFASTSPDLGTGCSGLTRPHLLPALSKSVDARKAATLVRRTCTTPRWIREQGRCKSTCLCFVQAPF